MNGMYVRVYGHLKSFQGVRQLVAFSVSHIGGIESPGHFSLINERGGFTISKAAGEVEGTHDELLNEAEVAAAAEEKEAHSFEIDPAQPFPLLGELWLGILENIFDGIQDGVLQFARGDMLHSSKSQENMTSRVSKSSAKANSSVPSQSSSVPANNTDDDFDDFDPRGRSTKASAGSSKQVDLFGQDLIGDLMDASTSVSVEKLATNDVPEVDLFADVAFVSAASHVDKGASS